METPDTSAGAPKLTDLSFLKIYSGDSSALMKQFIQLFLTKTPEIIQQMKEQWAANDLHSLGRSAHSLKPQLSYMGIKTAADLIASLEHAESGEKNSEALSTELDQLQKILSDSYTELNEELNHL